MNQHGFGDFYYVSVEFEWSVIYSDCEIKSVIW